MRRAAFRAQRQRAEREFEALRDSWAKDSMCVETWLAEVGTQFAADLRLVLSQHSDLLDNHRADVAKFLLNVPNRLAKYEGEYSWEYRAKLDEEIQKLLNGIAGKQAHDVSVELLARCHDVFPDSFSRTFLKAELDRRFNAKRSEPRPEFQLTLDYARRLTGAEFEVWLERLIRESGISSVQRTQQSRDQGADLIVEIGQRKIVIQAKQYPEAAVGNDGVQQAHAARGFYHASDAWVVTTSTFTKDAMHLASQLDVRLIPGSHLLNLPALLSASVAVLRSVSAKELVSSTRPPISDAEPSANGSQRSAQECFSPRDEVTPEMQRPSSPWIKLPKHLESNLLWP